MTAARATPTSVIRAERLGKRYHIGMLRRRSTSLRDAIAGAATAPWRNLMRLRAMRRLTPAERPDMVWALRDLSFEVKPGEVLGVIGGNGAGKSTLFKLLSRITPPTEGSAGIWGRVGSLLEVGTGFHPELTGRENIYLNGSILGMDSRYIERRFDEIVAFAGIGRFLDTPVKHYSSGMYLRLAFAVAAHLEPEILLVDEVLAVGDLAFQEKCISSLMAMKERGVAVVLVTHEMDAVKSHCDRAMLIEDGVVEIIGEPWSVTERFVEVILPSHHSGSMHEGPARVSAAWLADSGGRTTQTVPAGDSFAFCATIEGREPTPGLRLTAELLSHPEGVTISSFSVGDDGEIPQLGPGEQATVRVEIEPGSLEPGEYRFGFKLEVDEDGRILDRSPEPLRLRVTGEERRKGVVSLAHRVHIDHGATGVRR
jgi:lipopolysaccharide transport system ATP-binding protein